MMAKMRMANMTSKPICIKGARAFRMDFKTTCKPRKVIQVVNNVNALRVTVKFYQYISFYPIFTNTAAKLHNIYFP